MIQITAIKPSYCSECGADQAQCLCRAVPAAGSPMTAKDYCSTVCKAQCCRAHAPIVWPAACPKLTTDNLCSIYDRRIGFKFPALDNQGNKGTCICSRPSRFLKNLSPQVLAQCCIEHPELLENAQPSHTPPQ